MLYSVRESECELSFRLPVLGIGRRWLFHLRQETRLNDAADWGHRDGRYFLRYWLLVLDVTYLCGPHGRRLSDGKARLLSPF